MTLDVLWNYDWFVPVSTGLLAVALLLVLFRRQGSLHGRLAGWLRRRLRRRHAGGRIRREDALKHIYKWSHAGRQPGLASLAGALHLPLDVVADLVADLAARRLIRLDQGQVSLTPAGRQLALQVIRTHRLWERFLADETGVARHEWHREAERQEHALTQAEADLLAARLGHPTRDPHGDVIPPAGADIRPHEGQPLATWALRAPARIVHVSDQPASVAEKLLAAGLYPGLTVAVEAREGDRLQLSVGGRRLALSSLLADYVAVTAAPEAADDPANGRLSDLKPGQMAVVVRLSPACRGTERRRFLDLGLLPGTAVRAEFTGPGGDPTAYLIREAVIALRRRQADFIQVRLPEEQAP